MRAFGTVRPLATSVPEGRKYEAGFVPRSIRCSDSMLGFSGMRALDPVRTLATSGSGTRKCERAGSVEVLFPKQDTYRPRVKRNLKMLIKTMDDRCALLANMLEKSQQQNYNLQDKYDVQVQESSTLRCKLHAIEKKLHETQNLLDKVELELKESHALKERDHVISDMQKADDSASLSEQQEQLGSIQQLKGFRSECKVAPEQQTHDSLGTVLVAIKFDKGVVFGSDSRITETSGKPPRMLHHDNFPFKLQMLVDGICLGRAGDLENSVWMARTGQHYCEKYLLDEGPPISIKKVADHVARFTRSRPAVVQDTEYLVGGWDQSRNSSMIYKIRGQHAKEVKAEFAYGGCGSVYLYDLFEQYTQDRVFDNIDVEKAKALAREAVEYVCCMSKDCGGPIWTRVVTQTAEMTYPPEVKLQTKAGMIRTFPLRFYDHTSWPQPWDESS